MPSSYVKQLLRQRNRRADCYQQQAEIINLIGQRLLERLELVTIAPNKVLELGSADGFLTRELKQLYSRAQTIGIEPAVTLCKHARSQRGWFNRQQYLSALPDALPLQNESTDLVVINLYPIWQHDLVRLFSEISRVLTPDGLVLFTSMGPDTLSQIKQAWLEADPEFQHLMPYADMHDVGDALTRSGFHNIVMENEPLTITYSDVASLHQDLRNTGYANISSLRRNTLIGKNRFQRYIYSLEKQMNPNLDVTFDTIFGHGWKGYKKPKHAINAIPEQFENIPIKSLD